WEGMRTAFGKYDFSGGLSRVWELVAAANKFIVDKEPWKLAADPARQAELGGVLYAALEALRVTAILISPVMPRAARELSRQLGFAGDPAAAGVGGLEWGGLTPGMRIAKGEALFPRIDKKAALARGEATPKIPAPREASPTRERSVDEG